MNVIGVFAKEENGAVRGRIATLQHNVEFTLERNPHHDPNNSNSPSLSVIARGAGGAPVKIGAAWKKVAGEHSPFPGQAFFTLTLDDPSFGNPLHLTAYKREDGGAYDIVWRRQRAANRPQRGADPLGDEPAGGAPPKDLDDEIPF